MRELWRTHLFVYLFYSLMGYHLVRVSSTPFDRVTVGLFVSISVRVVIRVGTKYGNLLIREGTKYGNLLIRYHKLY